MKKLILGSIITAGVLLTGTAQAKYIDKQTEAKLVEICQALKSDSKIRVHKAIKKSGFKARAISKGLVCNGYDAVTFAMINNAENSAKFIAKKGNINYNELIAKL
ncbi:DUF3718 domain-containing protein [Paraglaciecola aestuariivivens]